MKPDDALVEFNETLPRLLIVDDEASIRDSLKNLGTDLGFQVYTANDGVHGCATFQKVKPDIVILDIYMPKMNGLKALEIMKQSRPECAVILVTGFLSFDKIVHAGGVPADAFAQKPFNRTKISNLIMDMMEKKMTPSELCE